MKLMNSVRGHIGKQPLLFTILFVLVITIVLLVTLATNSTNTSAAAESTPLHTSRNGVLDLSRWSGSTTSVMPLDGEWEFYWQQLLEPIDFHSSSTPEPSPTFEQVPEAWTTYRMANDQVLPNRGYATYRLRLLLPDETIKGSTLAIYPKSIASAYRIWINGQFKGGHGIVGTSLSNEKAKSFPNVIYFETESKWNEIIIQVSNFSQRNAGIWQSMELGTAESISWIRLLRVSAQSCIVGIFLVMALYYGLVYLNRKKEISALLYSMLCLSVGVRTVVLGESTALYLIPDMPWEWAVKAEYISVATTALLLILFINREHPKESIPWISKIAGFILPCFILLFLLTPARVYTYYLTPFAWGVLFPSLVYTLCMYVKSVFRRKKGSVISMIGFLFFMAFALNDMLFYTVHLPTEDMLSVGLLIFLLTQAYNLSSRFSSALQQKELLSSKLQQTNQQLERTVEERTRSLQQSNGELQQANQKMAEFELFRVRLLSNISHELSTPITSIKGFAKALRDGIITTEAPKYINRIYTRSLLLERMIHDLIELTKLETNQIQFHMQDVHLLSFVQELFQKYEWEVEEQGIHYRLELPEEPESQLWRAQLDPIRIEQVLSNLISNALRFTPPSGTIQLRLSLEETPQTETGFTAWMYVKDTGIGIPPEWHEQIFERFGQAQQQQQQQQPDRDHKGSGLGLAICKEIMYYHNGHIGVTSEQGSGSEFSIQLPAWKGG
ncbi:sensor histidine kinase [Paenibacillus sp. FSL R5-0623]|uniref:sensor histidine kinase n=1 Tax=Paenibacillus sp. FSL R5-0623 TaxID=2921651 RepID=UPI0030DA0AE9